MAVDATVTFLCFLVNILVWSPKTFKDPPPRNSENVSAKKLGRRSVHIIPPITKWPFRETVIFFFFRQFSPFFEVQRRSRPPPPVIQKMFLPQNVLPLSIVALPPGLFVARKLGGPRPASSFSAEKGRTQKISYRSNPTSGRVGSHIYTNRKKYIYIIFAWRALSVFCARYLQLCQYQQCHFFSRVTACREGVGRELLTGSSRLAFPSHSPGKATTRITRRKNTAEPHLVDGVRQTPPTTT